MMPLQCGGHLRKDNCGYIPSTITCAHDTLVDPSPLQHLGCRHKEGLRQWHRSSRYQGNITCTTWHSRGSISTASIGCRHLEGLRRWCRSLKIAMPMTLSCIHPHDIWRDFDGGIGTHYIRAPSPMHMTLSWIHLHYNIWVVDIRRDYDGGTGAQDIKAT